MLRVGYRGNQVSAWQQLLRVHGFPRLPVDGIFGPLTHGATRLWQQKHGLDDDGIVGPLTVAEAVVHGYVETLPADAPPPRPHGLRELKRTFGELGEWPGAKVRVRCGPKGTIRKVFCHALAAALFVRVFDDIGAAGESDRIHSYNGCYNHRKKSSGSGAWSTHAWGIAMDINASTNKYGQAEPSEDQKVLAPFFERHGFYWGANFNDPMHFQYCTGY